MRFITVAAVLAAAALLAGCPSVPRPDGWRVALVIGNAAYDNAPPLVNPTHDADDMCQALRRLRFQTLCHNNLRNRAEFDARVKEFTELIQPGSVAVFYYSGHGVQVGSENFLVPTQAQPQAAASNPTQVLYGVDSLLFGGLGSKPAQLRLVILDACRTDLFGAPPPGARGALVRALKDVTATGHSLQAIKDAPPNTKVFYATASRDAAFDGDGRNGPLTKHILQRIHTSNLELEQFFKDVTKGVETDTLKNYRKAQTPFTYGSYSGTFCFAGCTPPPPPGPVMPTP